MMWGTVTLSPRAVNRLVLVQAILTGLQGVAGAAILGDVIGPKWAALFIVLVSGVQGGVNYYASRAAGETVGRAEAVVSQASAMQRQAVQVTSALADIAAQTTPPERPTAP